MACPFLLIVCLLQATPMLLYKSLTIPTCIQERASIMMSAEAIGMAQ